MKKSIVLFLGMSLFSVLVVAAANVQSDRIAAADSAVIAPDSNANDSDNGLMSSPLSWQVHKKQYVGWVVDFYNAGNRTITVEYFYYNGNKWIENAVSVGAGRWNRNNNAGVSGNVRNVTWHY